jgi:hypothetical protein
MRHIVAFSGGAASAVVASIVAKEHPGETVLLYHSTKTEPADNDRFRAEVADYIGRPITEDSDGRDIWGVFDAEQYINGQFIPCSRILKQQRSLAFCLKQRLPVKLYFGFTREEGDRAQRVYARYLKYRIEARFPLILKGIGKQECLDRVVNCWGVRLPEMYAWAEHANCIPCVKGGMAYWGIIAMKYPEIFLKASQYEDKFGHHILQNGVLEELKTHCIELGRRYLAAKDGRERQGSLFTLPCECGV